MTTPGGLLQLVRRGEARTRTDLASLTGLARSTVSHRVEALISEGLLYEAGDGASTGGRPPQVLAFNGAAAVILAADLGATHSRLAVADLHGSALAERSVDLSIAEGPQTVLGRVLDVFVELLYEAGRREADVRAIGIGLPGPVEFATGKAVNPPIMPGWHDVAVPNLVRQRFDVPVLVDNDVNIMALGEYWTKWRDRVTDLMLVKVGTGIGCGIVVAGHIHRGAQGAAGDIGHIRLTDQDGVTCRCGNRGCVEAVAGGWALARQLSEMGLAASNSRDVVNLVLSGEETALRLVREAGRRIGDVLAGIVNFFNPAVILIGGDVAAADQQLLAGIREVVYQRSTALATRHLQILRSRLEDRAGITGAAVMAIEHVFAPEAVDQRLREKAVAVHTSAG